ncbi:MAG: hypothetical protein PVG64_09390 [Syntrophobacterales bacterium]|jgi:hypothetical protein
MKKNTLFNHPRSCPEGHRQISWHLKEDQVHCWLCDKSYTMSECSRIEAAGSFSLETEPTSQELTSGVTV